MPELPDVTVYVECLDARIRGHVLERVRLVNPFLLRSVEEPIESVSGRRVTDIRRIGKRIVIGLEGQLFLVFHLMIAGRFRWMKKDAKVPRKLGLAAFDFDPGTLIVTEAGTRKRASLHVVRGETKLASHDPGGINVMTCDAETFLERLQRDNHTIKRSLTDPRLVSGIGNAYSDEILHAARLSPFKLTNSLNLAEASHLLDSAKDVLTHWTAVLLRKFAYKFPGPGDITAFRDDFAVHGRYGQPCPICETTVQRIRYADNETNYCPQCQTGGRVLADRSLSRLLKDDWPRTIEAWEGLVPDEGGDG